MEVVVFSPKRGGAMVEHCRKYTVGYGVWHGSCPWPGGDRAGALVAPAGGVVIVVGGTVLQTWRDGVSWALQVRVLRAPAVVGHAAVPDSPGRSAGVHTRRSGRHVEVPDPSRGGDPGLRLRVMGIPLRGARGDTGPPPKQEVGPGPYVW